MGLDVELPDPLDVGELEPLELLPDLEADELVLTEGPPGVVELDLDEDPPDPLDVVEV